MSILFCTLSKTILTHNHFLTESLKRSAGSFSCPPIADIFSRERTCPSGLGQRYEYNSGVVDGAFFSARADADGGREPSAPLLSIVSREIEKERKENNEPNAFIHFLKISSTRRRRRDERAAASRVCSISPFEPRDMDGPLRDRRGGGYATDIDLAGRTLNSEVVFIWHLMTRWCRLTRPDRVKYISRHVQYAQVTLRRRRAGAAWNDSEITPPSSRLTPEQTNARATVGAAPASGPFFPASRAALPSVHVDGQGERRGSYDSRVSSVPG